jgi:hypothetical protein
VSYIRRRQGTIKLRPELTFDLCIIANALFETGLKFHPDVGQFLADPVSTQAN